MQRAFRDCILFSKKFEKSGKSNNLVLAGGAAVNCVLMDF